jgi:hypothetical protein
MSVESPQMWKDQATARWRATEDWLLGAKRAVYGIALVRILFGLNCLGFLAANWINRHYLWGDANRWLPPVADGGGFGWPFVFFSAGNSPLLLDLKLGIVVVLLVLLVLGWRTRVLAPVILVLWVSLIESQPIYGDQSDNIFRILFLYMCFADTSARWSLDARRRAKQAAGLWRSPVRQWGTPELRKNASLASTVLHNFAIVAVGAQICIIYVHSGLYKVWGEYWQDGTGVYYPLQVGHYAPWPALNELLTASAVGVMVATYFSVLIQVFFPLMLLRRFTRVLALLGVTAMHFGIAFFMGLPFFSFFILAADAIFIRDATYVGLQHWAVQRWRSRRRSDPVPRSGSEKHHNDDDSSAGGVVDPAGAPAAVDQGVLAGSRSRSTSAASSAG